MSDISVVPMNQTLKTYIDGVDLDNLTWEQYLRLLDAAENP